MPDANAAAVPGCCDHAAEIERLNRVIAALSDRAERDDAGPMSDFAKFQNMVLLERQVRERTLALEAALRENETITCELRTSTRELQASEQRFRALVQHSSDLTMILDDELVVRYATPAAEVILGRPPEDLLDVSIADFVDPDDLTRTLETAGYPRTKPGQSGRTQSRWRHADGSWRIVESMYTDRREDPTISGFVVNARDITQRVELERELQQSQKLEAVGQLASGIAHEINTPVQFIGDNLRFFGEGIESAFAVLEEYRTALAEACPEEALRMLATLEEEREIEYFANELPAALRESMTGVERIATIVRAMRAFGHPDGKDQAAVDMNQCIRDTLTVARNELKYVADVRTELDDALPPVICFRGDISQVVLNLVVNAAHAIADRNATTGERGTITVTSGVDADSVVVSVADTGCGIPDDVRHRIFEHFFTTKEVGRGTGQGLTIARGLIVERHHGSLTFDSVVGEGTTFTIRLPFAGVARAPED